MALLHSRCVRIKSQTEIDFDFCDFRQQIFEVLVADEIEGEFDVPESENLDGYLSRVFDAEDERYEDVIRSRLKVSLGTLINHW